MIFLSDLGGIGKKSFYLFGSYQNGSAKIFNMGIL